MSRVRRLSTAAPDFDADLARLTGWEMGEDAAVDVAVMQIIAAVRSRGDAALLEYTTRFDRVEARNIAALEISPGELRAALHSLSGSQRDALEAAARRIRSYHERQIQASWQYTEPDGTTLRP